VTDKSTSGRAHWALKFLSLQRLGECIPSCGLCNDVGRTTTLYWISVRLIAVERDLLLETSFQLLAATHGLHLHPRYDKIRFTHAITRREHQLEFRISCVIWRIDKSIVTYSYGSLFTMEVYCTPKVNTLQLNTAKNSCRTLTHGTYPNTTLNYS
jgi:hypothetical protein